MRKRGEWYRFLASLSSGAFMLQTAGCAETALVATGIFSAVTAGGVIYLVSRIVND